MIFCLESTTACMSEWSFFSSSSTAINLHRPKVNYQTDRMRKKQQDGGRRERQTDLLMMLFIWRSLSSCSLLSLLSVSSSRA